VTALVGLRCACCGQRLRGGLCLAVPPASLFKALVTALLRSILERRRRAVVRPLPLAGVVDGRKTGPGYDIQRALHLEVYESATEGQHTTWRQ